MSFEVFSLIWSHVNEMKKYIYKNQKCKILKKKRSGDIVKRYLSTKFGINFVTCSEKTDFTDDGRMDDGRQLDDSSSAVQ